MSSLGYRTPIEAWFNTALPVGTNGEDKLQREMEVPLCSLDLTVSLLPSPREYGPHFPSKIHLRIAEETPYHG